MAKQIFAYTETGNPPPFAFVRYAQAFVREDGFVVIALRDPSGHHVEVAIPPTAAAEMCAAVNTAVFPHLPGSRHEKG
jgi:hypothetical protein